MAARQSLAGAYRKLDELDAETKKLSESLELTHGQVQTIDCTIEEMRPPAERDRTGEMWRLSEDLRLCREDLTGAPIRLDLPRLVETIERAIDSIEYAVGAVAAISQLRAAIAVADT